MTYTKTNWQTGDVITAEKLNKLENGVEDASGGGSGGIMLIGVTIDEERSCLVLNKTYKEIKDAMSSGIVPIIAMNPVDNPTWHRYYYEPIYSYYESTYNDGVTQDSITIRTYEWTMTTNGGEDEYPEYYYGD